MKNKIIGLLFGALFFGIYVAAFPQENAAQCCDSVSLQTLIKLDSIEKILQQKEPIQIYEVMPSFPGGDKALLDYLNFNLIYPSGESLSGQVVCRFVVKEDGTVADAVIMKHLTPRADAEVLRVINIMPKWIPAMVDGKPVSVYYNLPVRFSKTSRKP
ncbi:MAG: energy transducer TonB [Dysgonamonadaceae bacterium]|nr:energy transducer TonB [Dysgonamonadaceae bacterium]